MSYLDIFVSVPIGILCGVIGGYVTLKYGLKMVKTRISDMVFDVLDDILQEAQTNPDFQQKILSVGILLGKGVRSGFGDIMGKGTGKFKIGDLLGIVAENVLPSILNKAGNALGNQSQPQPSTDGKW